MNLANLLVSRKLKTHYYGEEISLTFEVVCKVLTNYKTKKINYKVIAVTKVNNDFFNASKLYHKVGITLIEREEILKIVNKVILTNELY